MTVPDRYGVVGNPIAHSRSPQIHARFAEQTAELIAYERLLAPLDGFAAAVDAFRAGGGLGLNVTMPFKLEAYAYAAVHSDRARAAGAVNTLRFEAAGPASKGTVFGDNTDGVGLVNDLQVHLNFTLAGCDVLLLGAGGAARGVVLPLLGAGVRRLVICNRSKSKARALLELFHDPRLSAIGFDELDGEAGAVNRRADLVVNATSSGLSSQALPVPLRVFATARLAYDMVYGQKPTTFMEQALAAGCERVSDGLGMLVEQAAESFFVWRGVRPATAEVHRWLRDELSHPAQA